MDAKLIKINGEYLLNPSIVGTKLSLKNCQAIERGYELDELAKTDADLRYNQPGEEDLWLTRVTGIEYGFNLALSILGDKKFSEKDLRTAYGVGYLMKINPSDEYHETLNGLVQLLQQTEWDVEIVEECLDKNCDGINKKGECITTGKPKHDADGCLILKRVK
jgi:hypothetical protein